MGRVIKLGVVLAMLTAFDLSAQSVGYYERLQYRDNDPFVFCTQGQNVRIAPMRCWIPMAPFTGPFMMMPYCNPPSSPYGKQWTNDDWNSLYQYLRVCPHGETPGRWDGQGRAEDSPTSH